MENKGTNTAKDNFRSAQRRALLHYGENYFRTVQRRVQGVCGLLAPGFSGPLAAGQRT